ncbi:M28 family peptidase [Robiginitalea sp. SC105]|uniref:M28 family peptidase n=1 Tax=Robiginitalea sp. SC105 TaxID=2762332 RepID=UPI00163B39A0|nr:M28 family peptidase [Robiginitalea sp. SC105]MBC2837749.1 M28 family peptidase [Robiginitalea sp. SC105]
MKKFTSLQFLLVISMTFGQTDYEKAAETVQKNTVKSHLYFLSDDLLLGRETGTRGNRIAAAYLADQLMRFGVEPNPVSGDYYQDFELHRRSAPDRLELGLDGSGPLRTVALYTYSIVADTRTVFLNYGEPADYSGQEVAGKIVLVRGGTPGGNGLNETYQATRRKREAAMEHGALGLVELVSFDDATWDRVERGLSSRTGLPTEEPPFIHLWVQDPGSLSLPQIGAEIPITLDSDDPELQVIQTRNVVGMLPGTDPILDDEYIIYSAHYDHIGTGKPDASGDSIYNGARDNGIGTTAVLSIAENLGKYPTRRPALFVFFTAEELGLLGSRYYVEHPVIPLEKTVYCFNTDGGGYNDTTLATIIGLNRTTAKKHILEGARGFGLKPVDDPVPEQGLFDRSDNVSFARAGIPAPTYSTGFNSFDEEYLKYYHQLADEAGSLDYDYLLKFFRGYVLTGRLIANDPETPFWVPGDVYEPAGKALYQMTEAKN